MALTKWHKNIYEYLQSTPFITELVLENHELSAFVKIDGRWYFIDPTVALPTMKQPVGDFGDGEMVGVEPLNAQGAALLRCAPAAFVGLYFGV